MGERMDEMHLSVFHSVSNHARGKRSRNSISSAARYTLSTFFFFFKVRAKDRATFTLHDLADFLRSLERVTAHRNKINEHSCFHNRWPKSKTKIKTYLRARGAPWCFGGPTQLAYSA